MRWQLHKFLACLPMIVLMGPARSLGQHADLVYTPTFRGHFANGQRQGVWEYKDTPGEISLKVDYTKSELVYIKEDTSDFYISKNGDWVAGKLDIPCRFHGPISDLRTYYQTRLNGIALKFADKSDALRVQLLFEVNQNGLAENPVLKGNYREEVGKELLQAFEDAPNYWIVGITHNGEAVRSRMAITFEVCVGECEAKKGNLEPRAYNIFDIRTWYYNQLAPLIKRKFASSLEVAFENKGIQFSPDDRYILLERVKEEDGSRYVRVGVIIDTKTNVIEEIPFKDIKGATWLDPGRVLFKYHFPGFSMVSAVYDIHQKEIVQFSDSTTYFNTYSNVGQLLAMATYDSGVLNIWKGGISDPKRHILIDHSKTMIAPYHFSPRGTHLLLLEQEHGFEKPVVLDVNSGMRHTIPFFNAAFIGWNINGKSLYLCKVKRGDYKYVGEIYRYDIDTDRIVNILPKTKDLRAAAYSNASNRFALVLGSDLYLWDSAKKLQPHRIQKDIAPNIVWSMNGRFIAFFGKSDGDLHLYNLEENTSVKLAKF